MFVSFLMRLCVMSCVALPMKSSEAFKGFNFVAAVFVTMYLYLVDPCCLLLGSPLLVIAYRFPDGDLYLLRVLVLDCVIIWWL